MKRLVAVVVLAAVVGLVPAVALDGVEATGLVISFTGLGSGMWMVLHKDTAARLLGVFYLAIGVLGIVSVSCGWMRGDLLDEIRAGS
jgi:hypothetical protein